MNTITYLNGIGAHPRLLSLASVPPPDLRLSSADFVTFGENTWNQITSSTERAGNAFIIRLHFGSVITRAWHTQVMLYLQNPAERTLRANMRQVLWGLRSFDRREALRALGDAVAEGDAEHWEFRVHADSNALGAVYRLDLSTEAPLATEDLVRVQRYLDTRDPEGKPVLERIFKDERQDAAAMLVLDLE